MNNCILLSLIGCATLIAIIAIVFDYLTSRKCNNTTENLLTQKIVKIHRNYISGILSIAIVFLLTSKYGGPNNGIFEYLSFGSTITSMVLSILAIFVTVQSSSDLYKQFAKMEDATNTITTVSRDIRDTLTNISQAETKLDTTSKNLNTQIDKIVDEIDRRVKISIQGTEQRLTDKFREQVMQNDTANSSITTNKSKTPNKAVQEWADNWLETYVDTISIAGLLALYACCLSEKNNKIFKLSELFPGDDQYMYGILIASVSAGVITIDVEDDVIKCNQINISQEILLKELNNRIEGSKKSFANHLSKTIKGLEYFFNDSEEEQNIAIAPSQEKKKKKGPKDESNA